MTWSLRSSENLVKTVENANQWRIEVMIYFPREWISYVKGFQMNSVEFYSVTWCNIGFIPSQFLKRRTYWRSLHEFFFDKCSCVVCLFVPCTSIFIQLKFRHVLQFDCLFLFLYLQARCSGVHFRRRMTVCYILQCVIYTTVKSETVSFQGNICPSKTSRLLTKQFSNWNLRNENPFNVLKNALKNLNNLYHKPRPRVK